MCVCRHHLVPQHARLHDVALFHRGDAVLARARQFEGDAGDALDLERVVDLRVDAALLAVAEIDDLLRLAEIDAAGQLAHDQDVEAFDHLLLQRGGGGERRIADGGAEIGEKLQVLAQPQQAGFRAHLVGHRVPFRPADRAEQHGVGGQRLGHVGFRNRLAMRVIGGAADQPFLGLEAAAEILVHGRDQLLDLGHGLGADAVAGQEEEFLDAMECSFSKCGARSRRLARRPAKQGVQGANRLQAIRSFA